MYTGPLVKDDPFWTGFLIGNPFQTVVEFLTAHGWREWVEAVRPNAVLVPGHGGGLQVRATGAVDVVRVVTVMIGLRECEAVFAEAFVDLALSRFETFVVLVTLFRVGDEVCHISGLAFFCGAGESCRCEINGKYC